MSNLAAQTGRTKCVCAVHDGAMHDIMAMTRRPYAKKKNRGAIKDQPSKLKKLEEMEAAEERLQTQIGPGWCAELQIGDGKTGTANLTKRRLSAQTASIRRSIPARSNSKKSYARFSMAEFEYANTLLDLFSQGALPLTPRTTLNDLMCKVLHCPNHDRFRKTFKVKLQQLRQQNSLPRGQGSQIICMGPIDVVKLVTATSLGLQALVAKENAFLEVLAAEHSILAPQLSESPDAKKKRQHQRKMTTQRQWRADTESGKKPKGRASAVTTSLRSMPPPQAKRAAAVAAAVGKRKREALDRLAGQQAKYRKRWGHN